MSARANRDGRVLYLTIHKITIQHFHVGVRDVLRSLRMHELLRIGPRLQMRMACLAVEHSVLRSIYSSLCVALRCLFQVGDVAL